MKKSLSCLMVSLMLCSGSLMAQAHWPTTDWHKTEPKDVGLDAAVLSALDADISQREYGYVDSMLVIRHGLLAYERYYAHDYNRIYQREAITPGPLVVRHPTGPYNYFNAWWHPYLKKENLHSIQSVTKSVVAAVVGIAVGRGDFPDLDTPVLTFFDTDTIANVDDRKRRMTIRHLLTMTTGLEWNEDYPYSDPRNTFAIMARDSNWVKFTLDKPMSSEPGEAFQYNSGATLILGEVFTKATGMDLEEYAVRHLFTPLGIDNFFWKRTPFGLTDAQEGLFLTSRDMAKIAYLFLRKGQWQDRPIVPSKWIDTSVSPLVSASEDGDWEYGYKWWLIHYQYRGEQRVAFAGLGFGGQHLIVIPELDMVLVFTGWNIRAEGPRLTSTEAINRVLAAVTESNLDGSNSSR